MVVLAACDNDASDGSDDGPLAADFVARSPRVDCERQVRCGATPPASVDACVQAYDPGTQRAAERKLTSVAEGRVQYSARDASACLAAYAGSCSTPMTDILAICNVVFIGTQAVGDPCRGHFDCDRSHATAAGPYCFEGCQSLFGTEADAGEGTCVATSPAGTPACSGGP